MRLLSIGVLPGYDMTHEAAFAKLIWLVSRPELSFEQRQTLFQTPLAGEMSVEVKDEGVEVGVETEQ